MEKAKTVTEVTLATIKENEKIIVDEVMVEFNTDEFSPKHKVLHGSFRLSPGTPLVPGFYQLLLKDGRSYRIVVKGVRRRGGKAPVPALARFLVVPEE